MITAIVRFKAPAGASPESMAEAFRSTAPLYRGLPGLIRKYYLHDADNGTAGGVYLWESRAQAEATYDAAWRKRLTEKYGAAPEVSYFETPVVVDNVTDEILADAAE